MNFKRPRRTMFFSKSSWRRAEARTMAQGEARRSIKATQQRTELRKVRGKLMDGCERCPEDEAICVYRLHSTQEWCESCAEYSDWPERYKAASKRRTKALQRLRYIAQHAMREG